MSFDFKMFLWRNDDVTRQSRGVIYICLYICFPIYIYVYIHNLILCQNECQMSACGHALFVQRFMYTCICMHVCSFLLKRSMYDYKLYVSLLIFVYSLMDSDERASLQKKNVLNVKPFFVHVVQVMDDVVLHVSFVHVFNICCNEHIWYVHVTLHVVM